MRCFPRWCWPTMLSKATANGARDRDAVCARGRDAFSARERRRRARRAVRIGARCDALPNAAAASDGWKDGCFAPYAYAGGGHEGANANSCRGRCHKSTHTIVVVDALGRVRENLTIQTAPDGYRAALVAASNLRCAEWGIEGSGLYGHAFAVFVAASGASVFEVPGAYTKRHRRHSRRHGKSDLNDAIAIGEALLVESWRSFSPRSTSLGETLFYYASHIA